MHVDPERSGRAHAGGQRAGGGHRRTGGLGTGHVSMVADGELVASPAMELVLVRHALPVRIDATADGRAADPELAAQLQELAVEVCTPG